MHDFAAVAASHQEPAEAALKGKIVGAGTVAIEPAAGEFFGLAAFILGIAGIGRKCGVDHSALHAFALKFGAQGLGAAWPKAAPVLDPDLAKGGIVQQTQFRQAGDGMLDRLGWMLFAPQKGAKFGHRAWTHFKLAGGGLKCLIGLFNLFEPDPGLLIDLAADGDSLMRQGI